MGRRLAAAIVVALFAAFGGGFLAAKALDGTLFRAPGAAGASVWSMFGHPRDAHAPRQGEVKPDGFAIWKTRFDTSSADPLACIEMTRELDSAKSYADYVLVSPDLGHAPAVSVRGDALCIGGVGFTDRRITLLKGLPAKDGETLSDNVDANFANGDKPPFVGFEGQGVILPREESDGVGVITVNVSKLHVEVWRVVDRNLVRKSISAPDPTPEGQYAEDYGDDSPDDEGQMVWKGYVDVKGDPGQQTTTVFPLGAVLKEMKPGGYVIKARDASGGRDLTDRPNEGTPPAQARRWVMFTDMALISYTGQDALDVVVAARSAWRPCFDRGRRWLPLRRSRHLPAGRDGAADHAGSRSRSQVGGRPQGRGGGQATVRSRIQTLRVCFHAWRRARHRHRPAPDRASRTLDR